MNQHWKTTAEQSIGGAITRLAPLGGGDFAQSYCATLEDGRQLFIKTHANPPDGFFSTEAAGLQWLAASDSVAIPRVLAVADNPPFLALEWIEQGAPSVRTEAELGRQLAHLHRCTHPLFGRSDSQTTGSLGLPNEGCTCWAEFYATQRLLPLARIARERNSLSDSVVSALEQLAGKLDTLDVPDEPPALLHGDLWAGNRLIDSAGNNWLIDPASHGGHREFDIAMMHLFGGFGQECLAAYLEANPLASGWQDRISLHQLAPLVVHAIKFGGGYAEQVRAAVRQYL